VLGLSPADLETMTPNETLEAYYARVAYDGHIVRSYYEAARIAGFLSMLPHVKKNSLKKPQEAMKFGWEKTRASNRKELLEKWRGTIERWESEALEDK